MHALILVITRPTHDIDTEVIDVLDDFYCWKLDYHYIGGLWTGIFDAYDPATDPDNAGNLSPEWKRHKGDTITVRKLKEMQLTQAPLAVVLKGSWREIDEYEGLDNALFGIEENALVTAVHIHT